jgi:hypothetical protein
LNFTGGSTGEVVHLSNSGGNTVNVGSGGGSITIDGLAATDALFFADTQANATATPVSKTEVKIAFADTGQTIDMHFANHAAEVAIVGSLHYRVDPPQTLESHLPRGATRPRLRLLEPSAGQSQGPPNSRRIEDEPQKWKGLRECPEALFAGRAEPTRTLRRLALACRAFPCRPA